MNDGLAPLRETVARYGLAPKKSLGQNFIFDLNLTGRIARALGDITATTVVEIGPGPGGLTRALLANGAARVIAVERDARCLDALAEIAAAYPGQLDIVADDALDIDMDALIEQRAPTPRAAICANLPYNIGTALLTRWIGTPGWPPRWERAVLMFQREVALRIVATPLERADYGRLGVVCGWRTQARILFDVAPSAFVPPPSVTSSIVELLPRADLLPCDAAALAAVTQAAFGQRRKMLRQSLRTLSSARDIADLLARAEIMPTRRAEEIDVAGFVRLANVMSK